MKIKTKTIKLNPKKPGREKLEEAAEAIKRGRLVAFPTETVYGIGADALSEKAVERIFAAKHRPKDDPLIVHIADKKELHMLAKNIPKKAERLIHIFWPGALTLVLKKREMVPGITTANLDTVAVRMPANKIALELIRLSSKPIAAPSANLFGKPSPTKAEHVLEDLKGKVDIVIDGGKTEIGVESTILDLTSAVPAILRPGGVTREEIEKVIGKVNVFRGKSETAKAPGMKYRHYAPKAELVIVKGRDTGSIVKKINKETEKNLKEGKKVGILSSIENVEKYAKSKNVFVEALGRKNAKKELAKNLFSALRGLDKKKADVIFAEAFSQSGLGMAVMNRLKKAASREIWG